MYRLSLKYRIAAVIFSLEALMMAVVISTMLSTSLDSYVTQLGDSETALENFLGNLAHVALLTGEYDDLQAYVEQIVEDPHVATVHVTNQRGTVIISTDILALGLPLPPLNNTEDFLWRKRVLYNAANEAGTLAIKFSHAALLQTNRKMQNIGITIAVIGMSIIAIVGLLIGRLLTRRLEALTHAATQIADGNFDTTVNLRGNDEVAIVGKAFERMARSVQRNVAELEQSQHELRAARDELENRVEQRTHELAIARDAALQASRTKSSFLANMSHELRTPLNAIIGYSELIQEDARDSENAALIRDASRISHAGHHLLSLISNVLDLSKIEAGKMELDIRPVSIADLADSIHITVEPLLGDNRLEIVVADDVTQIHCDVTRLRQILLNLLSNACKFTEHGLITLGVSRKTEHGQAWVCFRVQDTGIGMSAEQIRTLFDEFTQADQSTTRKYGGTGLGMAISHKLCQAMGGNITVQSTPGQGSCFTVLLPEQGPQPAADSR